MTVRFCYPTLWITDLQRLESDARSVRNKISLAIKSLMKIHAGFRINISPLRACGD
jgi:hypothetical protein